MVTASLAGAHPLRNEDDDVSRLANLFHSLFKHYILHPSPTALDLIEAIRTLVGLGFTACLSDEVYTACYQPYLNFFLKQDRGNFKKHMAALVTLSENIANMVILGVHSFRVRYCPSYYQCFLDTIKRYS